MKDFVRNSFFPETAKVSHALNCIYAVSLKDLMKTLIFITKV